MDALLSKLSSERSQKVTLIKNYAEAAAERGSDLTETELATIGSSKERIAAIDVQIAALADDLEQADETTKRLARIDPSNLANEVHYRGDIAGGQFLHDFISGHARGDEGAQDRVKRFMKERTRAGEAHMGHDVNWTNPDDKAGDLKGLYVTPTTALIRPYWSGSPAASALGIRDLPGYEFKVPYLVDSGIDDSLLQGTGHTTTANIPGTGTTDPTDDAIAGLGGGASPGVAKTPVPGMAFTIAGQMAEAANYGVHVNIDRDRLLAFQPAALQIILDQLRLRLARQVERASLAELSASTGHITLAVDADGPTTYAAIVDGVVAVMESTFMPPDVLLVGPKGFGRLAKAADLAGRPLNPPTGPANATGGPTDLGTFSIADLGGLRVVVTHAITTDDMWLVNGEAIQLYGRPGDLLRTVEAVLRGETFSLGFLMAALRPTSFENSAVRIGA